MRPGGADRTCLSAAAGPTHARQPGQRTSAGERTWHERVCGSLECCQQAAKCCGCERSARAQARCWWARSAYTSWTR